MKRRLMETVTAQRAYRWYLRRKRAPFAPDWSGLLSDGSRLWNDARESSRAGPKVLIATSTGGHPSSPVLESLLAVALTLRGAEVHLLLCDSMLAGCLMAEVHLMGPAAFAKHGPQGYFCHGCLAHAAGIYEPLGLRIHRFSEHLRRDEMEEAGALAQRVPTDEIARYVRDGVAIGEHAAAGALRYFARANVDGQPHAEAVLRRYLHAAFQTSFVMSNLFAAHTFDAVCLNHALYVPQGIVAEAARTQGARVVAWNTAYRKQSFIFSHGETYHHTLMAEPVSAWEHLPWNADRERQTMDYLTSRRRSGRDWVAFQTKNPEENLTNILGSLGVGSDRPVIGMLTNVAWDAQLHYPANAFPDMLTWVTQTIAYFAKRPDLQLVIRVHPAEISGGIMSKQPVVAEIARAFPMTPDNVFIIPPESRMSTQAAMEACDAVIIYGTKTGVELTSLGVPVIVAGEAWIRNKGITHDVTSASDYFRVLDSLPFGKRMDQDAITRARKYAYHFFFRRMIPLPYFAPTGMKEPTFLVDVPTLEDLLPGRSRGLDLVCDGILKGTSFVYPAEDDAEADDGR